MDPIRNQEIYTRLLRKEIVPAVGCTEPISIALCAAKAHQVLGMQPTAVTVSVSAYILKNVKSVVVPNTNGLKGVRAAVAAGIVCGDADRGMQVISSVTAEQRAAVTNFLESVNIDVACAETDCPVYISVTLYARTSYARVVIANSHSNIVEIMRNGEALVKRPIAAQNEDNPADLADLNFHDIMAYAEHVDLEEIRDLLDMQIEYNTAICKEGLLNEYGADIGKILLAGNGSDAMTAATANAAAGVDARMSGCELPVATLCGSGSQGIAAGIPVICYANHFAVDKERLYRALVLSDLLTVYQKIAIGDSSSFCGTISAGCAAGAAVSYLLGGDETAAAQTFVNSASLLSGTFCDGAKPACAARAAAAVETGLIGYQMYLRQKQCHEKALITAPDVDTAVRNIGRIAVEGMTSAE